MAVEENWCGRQIKCELNIMSQPEGSVLLAQGSTVVMVSLYGPYELKHMKVQMEERAFQVNYRSKTEPCSNNERTKEELVKTACESVFFPKSFARHEIMLVVQEAQNDGGILSCAVNAGCVAMLNSGIEMQHLIVAVSGCMCTNGDIIIDPDAVQLKGSKFAVDVAFDTVDYEVVMINSEGTSTSGEYMRIIQACREASKHLNHHLRSIVTKYSSVLFAPQDAQ